MAHDLTALLARARSALTTTRKAAPADPLRSALDRARAALQTARKNLGTGDLGGTNLPPAIGVPKRETAAKEAVATADLGPGMTPPQVAEPKQPAAKADPADELPPKLVDFGGIPVLVDRPRGFVQRKLGPDGALLWERTYHVDYGYLAGTDGGDGEGLDVFLGPDPAAPIAWWVVQTTGAPQDFDEYKLMLGFEDEAAAKVEYLAHVPEKFFGSISPMPVDRLRALLGLPTDERKTTALKAEASAVEVIKVGLRTLLTASEKALDEHAGALARHQAGDQLAATQKARLGALLDAAGEATGTAARCELVQVGKAAPCGDEQFILGVVLKTEVTDLQKEIYGRQPVRETAHNYLAFFRNTDLQHKIFINDAVELVESYLAPVDFWIARDGTTYENNPATGLAHGAPDGIALKKVLRDWWLVAHRIKDPELWAEIKAGKFTGYSINGLSRKVPVAGAA